MHVYLDTRTKHGLRSTSACSLLSMRSKNWSTESIHSKSWPTFSKGGMRKSWVACSRTCVLHDGSVRLMTRISWEIGRRPQISPDLAVTRKVQGSKEKGRESFSFPAP